MTPNNEEPQTVEQLNQLAVARDDLLIKHERDCRNGFINSVLVNLASDAIFTLNIVTGSANTVETIIFGVVSVVTTGSAIFFRDSQIRMHNTLRERGIPIPTKSAPILKKKQK